MRDVLLASNECGCKLRRARTSCWRAALQTHGGFIEGGNLRNQCMAKLLSAIASTHAVPLDRIVAVRARNRRPTQWDAMVILLFVPAYGVASWGIARALSRRFPADERWPALIVTVMASLCTSALALQLFELWATILEMMRVGNDHLSGYRASWNPWVDHQGVLYIGGVLVFLAMAGLHRRPHPISKIWRGLTSTSAEP